MVQSQSNGLNDKQFVVSKDKSVNRSGENSHFIAQEYCSMIVNSLYVSAVQKVVNPVFSSVNSVKGSDNIGIRSHSHML